MYNQMEDLVPVTLNEFDPIAAIGASTDDNSVKKLRGDMLIEKALYPMLPQMMLYNFSFDNEDAQRKGVFAPKSIMGPRRRITIDDIKPGMSNVGYIKISSGRVLVYTFNGLITKVETVDGRTQVYSGDEVTRDDNTKQWFIQHVWNYSPVTQIAGTENYMLAEGDAEFGDLILEINLSPIHPTSEIKEYKTKSLTMYNAHSGATAMYYLSPKLELPRLSSDPIPPMPGSVPEPPPATPDDDAKPSESGPSIPPMPGGVEEEWLKPKSTDWWIS